MPFFYNSFWGRNGKSILKYTNIRSPSEGSLIINKKGYPHLYENRRSVRIHKRMDSYINKKSQITQYGFHMTKLKIYLINTIKRLTIKNSKGY
ncbi:uncharacterized protein VTP21DRAFT_7661 [Calcarisporiella thermophila]|uniref:uncharacterized protein n=1 Tax=Calcarisporiella thermophila TaxID=911321 RepID=UPI0037430B24